MNYFTSEPQRQLEQAREEYELTVSALPPMTQRRLKNEEQCGKYILDNHSESIAEAYRVSPDCEFILVLAEIGAGGEVERDKLYFSGRKVPDITDANNICLQEVGRVFYCHAEILERQIKLLSDRRELPVVVRWHYSEPYIQEMLEENLLAQPLQYVGSTPRPYIPPVPTPVIERPRVSVQPKKRVVAEKDLERELLKWIRSRGFDAENQIATSKHRMDIWIPGKCFLELKKGKVCGDDICQAIDYCAEYKLPVIIVGNHINSMASRGIEAFNKAIDSEMLTFVQWSAVKTYLKGLFSEWLI